MEPVEVTWGGHWKHKTGCWSDLLRRSRLENRDKPPANQVKSRLSISRETLRDMDWCCGSDYCIKASGSALATLAIGPRHQVCSPLMRTKTGRNDPI